MFIHSKEDIAKNAKANRWTSFTGFTETAVLSHMIIRCHSSQVTVTIHKSETQISRLQCLFSKVEVNGTDLNSG